jgi:2-amino-4-hydroxy-6-hydroxymethyldihydropteridine diphosphokinase
MNRMKGVFLLLGTNLGDKRQNLEKALVKINKEAGIIINKSSIYETEAWGFKNQPSFLNMVAEIDTNLRPEQLLIKINAIEKELGRIRFERWKERSIDIDILYYNDEVLETPVLQIPHPGIPNRKFTLVPLCELIPGYLHPSLNQTQQKLLEICNDELVVKKVS